VQRCGGGEVVQRPATVSALMYQLQEWRGDGRRGNRGQAVARKGRGGSELISAVMLLAAQWHMSDRQAATAGLDAGEARSWADFAYWASTVVIGCQCVDWLMMCPICMSKNSP
jgi:hypothetical protein